MSDAEHDVTHLLEAARGGSPEASDELLQAVYDELRELAHARMAREAQVHTLQPTALVHEAYLRLVTDQDTAWNDRGHFFGAAAQAMRRILIERARRRATAKHGAGRRRIDLDQLDLTGDVDPSSWEDLDAALARLERIDPRKTQIVMLRFFAGLTIEQTAKALDLSTTVIKDEWQFARAWLHGEISHHGE